MRNTIFLDNETNKKVHPYWELTSDVPRVLIKPITNDKKYIISIQDFLSERFEAQNE